MKDNLCPDPSGCSNWEVGLNVSTLTTLLQLAGQWGCDLLHFTGSFGARVSFRLAKNARISVKMYAWLPRLPTKHQIISKLRCVFRNWLGRGGGSIGRAARKTISPNVQPQFNNTRTQQCTHVSTNTTQGLSFTDVPTLNWAGCLSSWTGVFSTLWTWSQLSQRKTTQCLKGAQNARTRQKKAVPVSKNPGVNGTWSPQAWAKLLLRSLTVGH